MNLHACAGSILEIIISIRRDHKSTLVRNRFSISESSLIFRGLIEESVCRRKRAGKSAFSVNRRASLQAADAMRSFIGNVSWLAGIVAHLIVSANAGHHRARAVDSTQVKTADRVLRVHAIVIRHFPLPIRWRQESRVVRKH